MKKLLFLVFSLLIIGCSKDDGDAGASLKVTVKNGNDVLMQGVIITTHPATNTATTNSKGVAVLNNIPLGEYEIRLRIYNDPLDYSTPVSITELRQYNQTIIVMSPPEPIGEEEIAISAIIEEVYTSLKTLGLFGSGGYVYSWGSIGTDEVRVEPQPHRSIFALNNYQMDIGRANPGLTWNNYYGIVRRTNDGLDYIADLNRDLTPNELSLKAELLFFRAMIYFYLTKIYGNPVIETTFNSGDIDAKLPQGRKLAYDLIIEDLLFAKENLTSFTSSSMASKEAATALLGKVYLTTAGFPLKNTENYNKALEQFRELEGKFSLAGTYSSIFDPESTSENEVIFEIDFDPSKEGRGDFGMYWGPIGYPEYDGFKLYPMILNDYFEENNVPSSPVQFPVEAPDKRFYLNIATFKVENGQKVNLENMEDWRPYKGVEDVSKPAEWGQQKFDFIILRYADILLMQAEAINEISGPNQKAYDLVNLVRKRAYGDNKHDVKTGLDKDAFRKVLLAERKKEFFIEGHRKDDLVRMGMLDEVIQAHNQMPDVYQKDYQAHEYIWEIPQSVLNNNPNIKQNPGYPE